MRPAVLLMTYGGPDSLDDVEAYLLDIRGGRPTSSALVAEIRERYAQIGGRSPLLAITRAQAAALEVCLNALSPAPAGDAGYRVYVGMRHWKPTIPAAVAQIAREGYAQAIALCMAPHASEMSSGVYLKKLREAQAQVEGAPRFEFIESWHDQPFLIRALAEKVRAAARMLPPGFTTCLPRTACRRPSRNAAIRTSASCRKRPGGWCRRSACRTEPGPSPIRAPGRCRGSGWAPRSMKPSPASPPRGSATCW